MRTGRQFTGTVAPNATARWFTFNWPSRWQVIWTVQPTTPQTGGPQLDWDVAVECASSTHTTYWITVVNRTDRTVGLEGRYAVLND